MKTQFEIEFFEIEFLPPNNGGKKVLGKYPDWQHQTTLIKVNAFCNDKNKQDADWTYLIMKVRQMKANVDINGKDREKRTNKQPKQKFMTELSTI